MLSLFPKKIWDYFLIFFKAQIWRPIWKNAQPVSLLTVCCGWETNKPLVTNWWCEMTPKGVLQDPSGFQNNLHCLIGLSGSIFLQTTKWQFFGLATNSSLQSCIPLKGYFYSLCNHLLHLLAPKALTVYIESWESGSVSLMVSNGATSLKPSYLLGVCFWS